MLSCRDVTALVSRSQDRDLTHHERWGLRLHLLYCRGCRAFASQIQFLRQAMRELEQRCQSESNARLSLAARTRIRQALEKRDSPDV